MPFALVSIAPIATPWRSDKTNGLALACSRYRRGWRVRSAISNICAVASLVHQRNVGIAKIRSMAWMYSDFDQRGLCVRDHLEPWPSPAENR